MSTKKSVLLTVSGKVQNVGFRYFVKTLADNLKVKGFVKNLPNGKVYIDAEGNEESLALFIDSITNGPSHAYVDEVVIQNSVVSHYTTFEKR